MVKKIPKININIEEQKTFPECEGKYVYFCPVCPVCGKIMQPSACDVGKLWFCTNVSYESEDGNCPDDPDPHLECPGWGISKQYELPDKYRGNCKLKIAVIQN